MEDIAIVYMVAGMSSRFGGKVKQLAEVGPNNETFIECSVNQAISAGFTKIIFVVGEKTEKPFKEIFGNKFKGIPVLYAFQEFDNSKRDKPWGTADALCSAKNLIDCPFIVCNGDDLYGEKTFKKLVEHLKNKKTSATIGYKLINAIPEKGAVNRATFELDKNKCVKCIKERFNISRENLRSLGLSEEDTCSHNIFAFYPEIVSKINVFLNEFKETNKNDRKAECLLPEEISRITSAGKLTIEIYPEVEVCLGITNPGDEIEVRKILTEEKV